MIKSIFKGIWNKFFGSKDIKQISEYRTDICRTNKCGFYDPKGESEAAVLRGYETCGVCGCSLSLMTSVLEESCSLEEIGKTPLWTKEEL